MALEGRHRMSGIYGSAWRNGQLLAEVVEVNAPVELGRIEVPLVGTPDVGHKPGGVSREGTMRIHKVDSAWELELYNILSQSLEQRRAARDAGNATLPEFSIVLKIDDPDALGVERWQLDGVRLWRLTLGFSRGDEITEREYPITWRTEKPLTAFKATTNAAGQPAPLYVHGQA